MAALPALAIAGAVIGGYSGIQSNKERARQARLEEASLRRRKTYTEGVRSSTSKILRGNLEIAALDASSANRKNAVDEFQAESEAQAALGASGLAGGTPFYALASSVIENQRAVMQAADRTRLGLEGMQESGRAQIAGIENSLAEIGDSLSEAAKASEYYNSGAAYFMSALSGALGGGASGANLEASLTSALGKNPTDLLSKGIESGIEKVKDEYERIRGDAVMTKNRKMLTRARAMVNPPDLSLGYGSMSFTSDDTVFDMNNPSGSGGLDVPSFGTRNQYSMVR